MLFYSEFHGVRHFSMFHAPTTSEDKRQTSEFVPCLLKKTAINTISALRQTSGFNRHTNLYLYFPFHNLPQTKDAITVNWQSIDHTKSRGKKITLIRSNRVKEIGKMVFHFIRSNQRDKNQHSPWMCKLFNQYWENDKFHSNQHETLRQNSKCG